MSPSLDVLFPTPSRAPSSLAPVSLPGSTREAIAVLRTTLKDNHEKFHIFTSRETKHHNHLSHHLLALHSLGASPDTIQAAYDLDAKCLLDTIPSPKSITEKNFGEFLGHDEYYRGYFDFFADILINKGVSHTLEKYIFGKEGGIFDKSQPTIFNRFFSGLFHPLIHTGYGLEFGLIGMMAEGLAQGAVTDATSDPLVAPLTEKHIKSASPSILTSLVSSLTLRSKSTTALTSEAPTHILNILARILKDPALSFTKSDNGDNDFEKVASEHSDLLIKYAEQWAMDINDPKMAGKKIEELSWANVVIYGIGGWDKEDGFKAEFFLMHLVTSSVFLSSYIPHLSPASLSTLLQAYLVTSLAAWISRGRPSLDIKNFMSSTESHPFPPASALSRPADEKTLPSPSSPFVQTPNSWLPILQSTITHPDDHVCKVQRTLGHYASLYGGRLPREKDFVDGVELEGAEYLDGTLFVRVAGLTAGRMGWMREGEEGRFWDF